jgi:hypothetical protein
MTDALLISEIGLLAWLVWFLQPYERPCLCCLILVMVCAHASYHIPRSDAEYHASATVQSIAIALAIAECLWLVEGRPRVPVAIVAIGSAILVGLVLRGLDYRFGEFTTYYVYWLCLAVGLCGGGALAAWDGRLLWLCAWCGARAVGGLSFWFIRDMVSAQHDSWPAWWSSNNHVQLVMLVLTLAYMIAIPVTSRNTATRRLLQS